MADGVSWNDHNRVGDSAGEPPAAQKRSFALSEPAAPTVVSAPPRRAPYGVASLLVVVALAILALATDPWVRAGVPLGLLAVAIVLLALARRDPLAAAASPSRAPRNPSLTRSGRLSLFADSRNKAREVPDVRTMVLDGDALTLESTRHGVLVRVDLGPTFGAVLLSSRRRDRLAVAITTRAGTFLVGTRLDAEARKQHADVLGRSSVLGGDEDALDATGPDGRSVCLDPPVFRDFVEALEALETEAVGRIVLSDQRGDPIRLDGEQLHVRHHHFDLSRPLEWRPMLFQEQFGQAITLYQGTWVRQGNAEVVFVSLLSPAFFDPATREAPDPRLRGSLPELDVLAVRDQRLLRAGATDPPATEHRVAMDGLFVVPLRAALDQAPRPSSQPSRARYA